MFNEYSSDKTFSQLPRQDQMSIAFNPNAVNHPVRFCNGEVKWERMSKNQKDFYQKFMLTDYANFLNASAID